MRDLTDEYYGKHYNKIHYRGTLGKFTELYHSRLEQSHTEESYFEKVLEIGGGRGSTWTGYGITLMNTG